jgi:hypothetical protein
VAAGAIDVLEELPREQRERIELVTKRFGCADDFVVERVPMDLPEGWTLVIMGHKKGRLRSFGVSPAGDISS